MPPSTEVERTLLDANWLRQLARTLVRDDHSADDLAQDTWLAVLRQGFDRIADLRGFMVTTLRNNARQRWRREARAAARLAALPSAATAPGSDQLVANLQEQRALLAAVEQLEEPSRSTVLLRYAEGLPPRVIAARLQLPVATVQTRLKRGLARLRERLDALHGSRAAWLTVYAPWAASPAPLAPWFGGLLFMHTHTKLALAALAFGAIGLLCWSPAAPTPGPLATNDANAAARVVAAAPPASEPSAASPERDAAALPAGTPAVPEPAATTRIAHGRALQLSGAPLARVAIACRGGSARTQTVEDGTFALPLTEGSSELEIDDAHWTTVFFGDASRGEAAERVVVGAPREALHGRVVDAEGLPIADATLRIWLPPTLRALLPQVLDYSSPRWWNGSSDADGRFTFADCAQLPGVDLQITKAGYQPARHALSDGMRGVVVTLRRPPAGSDAISGCVLDARGALVAGAHVAAGGTSTATDARGEFTLPQVAIAKAHELVAVAKGQLPARAPVPTDGSYVVLRSPGEARTLSGRVVDRDGKPMPGCKVWVADPTYFGKVDQLMVAVEGMLGDARTAAELSDAWQQLATLSDHERSLRLPPDRMWSFCRTDADGAFELRGLADRPYRLRALVERTLLVAEFGPFAAGSRDVQLQLPTDRMHTRLSGQVVDTHGQPVADARIRMSTEVVRIGSEGSWTSRSQVRDAVRADRDGRFTLRDVPHTVRLVAEGDGFETTTVQLDGQAGIAGAPDDVRITVPLRCHFRVELADPTQGDAIVLLDQTGAAMDIARIEGTSRYTTERQELHGGRSPVLSVTEGARTLVLFRGDTEVKRLDVALAPGQVTVLTP